MLLENVDALKAWLIKTVEPICDADPQTLSKYVVALIKKDKSTEELREICLTELEVFLTDHSTRGAGDGKPVAKIPATRSSVSNLITIKREPHGDDEYETPAENTREVETRREPMRERDNLPRERDHLPRERSGERRRSDRDGDRYRGREEDKQRHREIERDKGRERGRGAGGDRRSSRDRDRRHEEDLRSRLRTSRSRSPANRRTRRERTPVHGRLGLRSSRSPGDARRRLRRDQRTPDYYKPRGSGYMRSDLRRSPSPRSRTNRRSRSASGGRPRAYRRSRSPSDARSRLQRKSRSPSDARSRLQRKSGSPSDARSRLQRRSPSPTRSRAVKRSSRSPRQSPAARRSRSVSIPVTAAIKQERRSPVAQSRSSGVRKRSRSRSVSQGREVRLRSRSPGTSAVAEVVTQMLDKRQDDISSSDEDEDTNHKYRITRPLQVHQDTRQPPVLRHAVPPGYLPDPVVIPAALPVHQRLGVLPPALLPPTLHVPLMRPRCRDYDDKGFCLRGDMCPFDHGADPLVVDDSAFNASQPPPAFRSHVLQQPIAAQHVNPFGIVPRPGLSLISAHRFAEMAAASAPVPQPSAAVLPASAGVPVASAAAPTGSSTNRETAKVKSEPVEEMIHTAGGDGRVVIDRSEGGATQKSFNDSDRRVVQMQAQPVLTLDVPENGNSGAGNFDRRRLGAEPAVSQVSVGGAEELDGRSVIVDGIPADLNKIEHINSHFCKFGRIVNLQVCYGGLTSRALVCYASPTEADLAYRSIEPVLSNRFIRILRPAEIIETAQQLQADISDNISKQGKGSTGQPETLAWLTCGSDLLVDNQKLFNRLATFMLVAQTRLSVKSRLGGQSAVAAVPVNHQQLSFNPASQLPAASQRSIVMNRAVTAQGGAGIVQAVPPKTKVVTGAALKINRVAGVASSDNRNVAKQKPSELLDKQRDLIKQKQQLLQKQLEQLNVLIAKVQSPTLAAAEKEILKEMIKKLEQSSAGLKSDLQKLTTSLSTTEQSSSARIGRAEPMPRIDPQEIRKQLLDAELELISIGDSVNKESQELKNKISVLRMQAAGFMRGGGRGRGRGSSFYTRGRGGGVRGRGSGAVGRGLSSRGRGFSGATVGSRLIDRRSKQLIVSGDFNTEEMSAVIQHLSKYGLVESWQQQQQQNDSSDVNNESLLVSFTTRKDAEKAAREGSTFNNKSLKMTWHQATPTTEPKTNECKTPSESGQSDHGITDKTFMGDTRLVEALRVEEELSRGRSIETEEEEGLDYEGEEDEVDGQEEEEEGVGYEENEEPGEEGEESGGVGEEQATILLEDASYEQDDDFLEDEEETS